MAGLETLSGRMSVLEENVLDLQSDLASAQQTVSEFQAKIDEANTRSIMLEERVGLFERFLTGLRDLMNSGFPAP
jgi:predicted  nucleic acid-binding Zn-ribbon protein